MKSIRNFISSVLYELILVLIKLSPYRKGTKHLLIIKLDEIGDYVLFRNQLKYFKSCERYKSTRITLIGTDGWKAIFERYDSGTVDNVIWINKKKFNSNLLYRFRALRNVRLGGFSEVVNVVFSRSLAVDDCFAFAAPSFIPKITIKGDMSNKGRYAINIDKLIYNQIIDGGDEKIFDSIRNANFLKQLLGINIVTIDSSFGHPWRGASSDYYAIFLGAGNPERRWLVEHYVKCAEHIEKNYGLRTMIFGGPSDVESALLFERMFKGKLTNMVGKTTLPEFIMMLNQARFTISVDTGPLHMAVAAKSPVIGLFSGRYYKRYSPYPKEITNYFYPVYPDFIDEIIAEGSEDIYNPFKTLNNTIKCIEPEKVIRLIDKMMEETSSL